MSLPRAGLAILCGAAGAAAQQPPANAFVETHLGAARAFAGGAVEVTVRIGLEKTLAERQLIQLFRRRLDVAVRVETPWAKPIDGFEVRGVRPATGATASAVVDGAVGALRRAGEVTRDGRPYLVYEVQGRVVPVRTGTLAIPPGGLQFSFATRFEEDFFGDRVPADRRDVALRSAPVQLEVDELPAAGRPKGFSGLIGRFTARVEVASRAVRVGEAFALRLVVAGDGDLAPFTAPSLADLREFHPRGVRQETEAGQRVVVYELVALRAGKPTVPPIRITSFDPGPPPAYRTIPTEAIEMQVAPAADGTVAIDARGRPVAAPAPSVSPVSASAEAAPPPIPGVDVLFPLQPVAPRPGLPPPDFAGPAALSRGALVTGLLAPLLWALGLWLARRRAGSHDRRARAARRRRAGAAFQRALQADADRAGAVAAFAAAWLDCAPAAVVDRTLPARLVAAGLAPDLAADLDGLLDRLAGARFGGEAPPDDAELLATVGRADACLRESWAPGVPWWRAALLIALLVAPLQAQDPPDPAVAAQHFRAGDHARAAAVYRQALDAGGYDPAALCLDLGNCAHRLGRPAEAVLWYTRALRADPGHLEARANLRLVERQLGVAGSGRRGLVWHWLEGVAARADALSPGTLLLIAALLQVLGVSLVLRRRRLAITLLAAGLALAVWVVRDQARGGAAAIVLRDGVRLQAEPHARAGALATLRPGATIDVLEASPRWARVRSAGEVGWVEARSFERVALR